MSDAGERQSRPRSKGLVRRSSRIKEMEQELSNDVVNQFGLTVKKEEPTMVESNWEDLELPELEKEAESQQVFPMEEDVGDQIEVQSPEDALVKKLLKCPYCPVVLVCSSNSDEEADAVLAEHMNQCILSPAFTAQGQGQGQRAVFIKENLLATPRTSRFRSRSRSTRPQKRKMEAGQHEMYVAQINKKKKSEGQGHLRQRRSLSVAGTVRNEVKVAETQAVSGPGPGTGSGPTSAWTCWECREAFDSQQAYMYHACTSWKEKASSSSSLPKLFGNISL